MRKSLARARRRERSAFRASRCGIVASRAASRTKLPGRGTEGSNPSPSSAESVANLTLL
jgi:hypothetical protein